MIDTTIITYATRRLGAAALALGLALTVSIIGGGTASTRLPVSAPAEVLPGSDQSLAGAARVIDGDTIEIGAVRIRLEGIDAPETDQNCTRKGGGTWRCGIEASLELARMSRGNIVRCERRGLDKYGRTLAVCFVGALDINAELVRRGLAWAFVRYSTTYATVEAEARVRAIGIWQAETRTAWDHRAERWSHAEAGAPEGCAIKGNVTRHGRIYHMPWSPWYQKVRIEAVKGERWFCSEADAVAAGWRPAVGS